MPESAHRDRMPGPALPAGDLGWDPGGRRGAGDDRLWPDSGITGCGACGTAGGAACGSAVPSCCGDEAAGDDRRALRLLKDCGRLW